VSTTTTPVAARDRAAALYARLQPQLYAHVRRRIIGDDTLIEDACANAWAIYLQRPPETSDDGKLLAWLCVVARHEAYRLGRTITRERPVEELADSVVSRHGQPERYAHARDALRALASLRPLQRETLALFVAGHSYKEIQAIRGVTYTNVNRHIAEGRAALRAIAVGSP
jgi:RNA polymerase sigma factor (sigma-70 family)